MINKKETAMKIDAINKQSFKMKLQQYKNKPFSLVLLLLVFGGTIITVGALFFLIGYILVMGIPNITPDLFSWEYTTENVSVVPSIINTLVITLVSLLIAAPIGICSSIYLVEYANRGNKIVSVIRMATETLSGIPSIVYGLFGMLFFVTTLGWGYSLIAGIFTITIMILPLIIRTTEEALKTVPDSYREGSFGLGAGKLRTVFLIVLPSAIPGILAGVILSIGRIVGETAALMYTAGTVTDMPEDLLSSGRTLAVHMYQLSTEGLHVEQSYATAVILLLMVVVINALSALVAKKLTKR